MAEALLIATAILVIALIYLGTGVAADRLKMPENERRLFTNRALLLVLPWVGFVWLIGISHQLAGRFFFIPPVVLASAIAFALSPVGRLIETLPYHFLVGFQGFRVLAELYLHLRYVDGAIPKELTFNGSNFDIATGILALLLAPVLARKPRRPLIWGFSVLGVVLLVKIVAMHVMLAPESVAAWPYDLLPGVLVWGAVTGHVILFRKLIAKDP